MFRKELRDNNEINARHYMTTNKFAIKLVQKLSKSMKVRVNNDDGSINENRSLALSLAMTQELFVENRMEQIRKILTEKFQKKEMLFKKRLLNQEEELEILLERTLNVINIERAKIRDKLLSWRVAEGNLLILLLVRYHCNLL